MSSDAQAAVDPPARPAPEPVAPTTSPKSEPKTVLQWVLVYPALAIAVISALPNWIDGTMKAAAKADLSLELPWGEQAQQFKLWKKNADCATSPTPSPDVPIRSNIRVAATVCHSGDIFVHVATNDPNNPIFYYLDLRKVLGKQELSASLVGSAAAAEPVLRVSDLDDNGLLLKVQLKPGQQEKVLCQKFPNNRQVIRRVQRPQGCFDLTVDTYTGRIVGAPRPVACRC